MLHAGEWSCGCRGEEEAEEITYTLFCIAQFLGFVEVVRRDGPRERSFLLAGNPQVGGKVFNGWL